MDMESRARKATEDLTKHLEQVYNNHYEKYGHVLISDNGVPISMLGLDKEELNQQAVYFGFVDLSEMLQYIKEHDDDGSIRHDFFDRCFDYINLEIVYLNGFRKESAKAGIARYFIHVLRSKLNVENSDYHQRMSKGIVSKTLTYDASGLRMTCIQFPEDVDMNQPCDAELTVIDPELKYGILTATVKNYRHNGVAGLSEG